MSYCPTTKEECTEHPALCNTTCFYWQQQLQEESKQKATISVSVTAENELPEQTKAALTEAVKHAVLSKLVEKHLHFEGKTNDKWNLQASVKTYMQYGKISGSFFQAIESIAKEYAAATNWK